MKEQTKVDLDALLTEKVVTLGGRDVKVRDVDGVGYQMLGEIKDGEDHSRGNLQILYDIAKRCLPSLSEQQVMELTPTQVGAVVGLAREKLNDVESSAPKTKTTREKRKAGTPSP